MMRLDHFDIPICIQRLGHFLRQPHQQVDPQRHIPGLNDHGMAGGRIKGGVVRGFQSCGANHVHSARLGGKSRKFDACCGRCEINHGCRAGKRLKRIICDDHAQRCAAHGRANILPDPRMTAAFNTAHQFCRLTGGNRMHKHLAHPA